jgi:NAD(P)-dependent dehydrogenase (short-subunit alcohol dehydrogenase family)
MEPFGIYVVLVEPGFFLTDMLDSKSSQSERLYESTSPYLAAALGLMEMYRRTVIPNAGNPNVVAKLIADVAAQTRPKLRYVAGRDGKLLRLLRSVLSASQFQRIFVRQVAKHLRVA